MAEILYAITDVHGMAQMLDEAYGRIVADAAGRAARVVFLGDAVDRGPDSRGCIERLIAGAEAANFAPQIDLMGNHEAMMMRALGGDEGGAGHWLANGGEATMASYGGPAEPVAAGAAWLAIPASHADWLAGLRYGWESEHHLFVHAGLPPGSTLAGALASPEGRRQLTWIREPFLSEDHDFGKHVVHGHSPLGLVDFRDSPPYRTNLDSGAVYGGPLTIGVIEPGERGAPRLMRVG